MGIMNRVMRAASTVHAALYRRIDSPRVRRTAGLPILLLTVRGRKSGQERTTPVCYIETDGSYAVVGSAGGSDDEPQWFRNLRAASEARIEIGQQKSAVAVRVAKGAERDALWQRFVTEGTTFAGYEKKADRVIPVAILTPR